LDFLTLLLGQQRTYFLHVCLRTFT
jgi:hypothetical protein